MASDRSAEEQAYFSVLDKYKAEKQEAEAAEAKFEEDLKLALALSLDSDDKQTDMSFQSKNAAQGHRSSRRNRQFVHTGPAVDSDSDSDSDGGDNSTNHPSGRRRSIELAKELRRQTENEQMYHPSGRRRSIEMAEELKRQMENKEVYHPSGRRRSIEIAQDMQKQMMEDLNQNGRHDDSGAEQYHPSGRRRSIEIAQDMQRKMLLEGSNHDDQYHPSGRMRSLEIADAQRNQMMQGATGLDSSDDEMTKEIQELVRRGVLPSNSRPPRNDQIDSELFGDGAHQGQASAEGGRRPQHHVIDFKNPFPFDERGIPTNWDKTLIAPYSSETLFHLVKLVPGEEEYDTIANDFQIADLEAIEIERLQNLHQLDRFKTEQEHLTKRNGPEFEVNARYLYHGSTAIKHNLCEEGLDARLAMSGCFGKGIYFSDNPKKCEQYVSSRGEKYILMCRVMLGEAKVYHQGIMDANLVREPLKENPTGSSKYYDSVKGRPIDYNEFVVYESRRAMIEYIVTFCGRGQKKDGASGTGNQIGGAVAANMDIEPESVEDHMKRIMQVREDVRRARATEKGEAYVPPSHEQRKKDRDIYRRVLLMSCPPGTSGHDHAMSISDYLQHEETQDTSGSQSDGLGNHNNNNNEAAAVNLAASFSTEDEEDSVKLVMSHLVADFLQITNTNNSQMAQMYLEKASTNLDQAIILYYEEN